MGIQCVIIKTDLCIQRQQVPSAVYSQWIDFDLASIFVEKQAVKPVHNPVKLANLFSFQLQGKSQFPALVSLQASRRIDHHHKDLFR